MDAAYYIAKELLMTERTYKKDLQVIAVVCSFNLVREHSYCILYCIIWTNSACHP